MNFYCAPIVYGMQKRSLKSYDYSNKPNNINQTNTFEVSNNLLPNSEEFLYTSALSNKTIDGEDDGKISFKSKCKNFCKGLLSPITSMFSSAKNLVIGASLAAGCAILTAATGGAIVPVFIAMGVVSGGVQFVKGAYKASTATTDSEAQEAWQSIGCASGIVAGSVIGAKSALKTVGVKTDEMNMLQATVECFKQSPKAISNSFKTFKSGAAFANIKALFNKKSNVDRNIENKETIELKETRFDSEGIVENLEKDMRIEPRGEKINSSSLDKEFQESLKSLGTIDDDGIITINQNNSSPIKIKGYIEEINNKKVLHLYDMDDKYIADFYDGAIVSDKNFKYYLSQDGNNNIIFGRKFNPEGYSTSELETFYSQKIQELYLKNNGKIKLQDIIDLIPQNSSCDNYAISQLTGELTTSQSSYSISDNCVVKFLDSDGTQWNIRVHSQDITSGCKNWILRISHSQNDSKKFVFLDTKNFDFSGIAKNAGSQTSHISIEPFFTSNKSVLNDGNAVSFLSFISGKLNSNISQFVGKIRSFAFNIKPKGMWKNAKDTQLLLVEIQKQLGLNSLEETLATIFNYH